MSETLTQLRERAARELRAARNARTETEREIHKSIANACKALAESEAWLEGRIRPEGQTLVRERK